jgi:hypothetical protein
VREGGGVERGDKGGGEGIEIRGGKMGRRKSMGSGPPIILGTCTMYINYLANAITQNTKATL